MRQQKAQLTHKSTYSIVVIFSVFFLAISVASFGAAQAQSVVDEDVTDEELLKFIEINRQFEVLQEEAEEQMKGVIREHGLTPERYNEIVIMENNPEIDSDASNEELEKARAISDQIIRIQERMQGKAITIIEQEGLTPERFQEIGTLLQISPELQQRFNDLLQQGY
ncbi:DUF4168 domain-containing protein [Chitinispirillales bacterium ANBcel5]|uniref:DUF4168 domain-containing protein n=1 Tax=Cellulosispirillum alkaliphilum TaxID=3039283 RepID=UPI002A53C8A9|nr:DUF4168 domain-containing protein [Chitinispirillales bacterium ANBcel5]